MKCGIYCIENLKNGKVYVGQSRNIPVRWSAHRRAQDSDSSLIARAILKHGLKNFEFTVLEYCSPEKLDERERHYIVELKAMYYENGYNIESGGHKGEKITPLVRQRKSGKKSPNYGKKATPEQRRRQSESHRGKNNKLDAGDVEKIKQQLVKGANLYELAEAYSVTYDAIHKILQCKNWSWVLPELNDDLINLTDRQREKRNTQIGKLWDKNKSATEISKIVNCNTETVKRVIGTSRIIEAQKRNAAMVKDFQNGMTRDEIQERYGVRRHVVNTALRDATQEQRRVQSLEWLTLRRRGVGVGEIAERYGVHRTTVTENTRDFFEGQRDEYPPGTQ